MYNLLIGGAAGQGVETTVAMLEKLLKKSGYFVFTIRDFMSRVRGGHNFSVIRFGTERITSHSEVYDGIIALNDETVELHKDNLREGGFILCDSSITTADERAIKLNLNAMAKELGNVRVSGSIAIGAILKLFGNNLDNIEDVLQSSVKEQVIEVNKNAIAAGYNSVEQKFEHLDGGFQDYMVISGSEALGLGAIAGGLQFYSAYPMSPSTAVLEYLAGQGDEAGIVVEQAEDEIAGINMAIGASFAGAKAMTGTSGGGFCLKVEALGLSGIAEIPLVVVDVQRPGPATGLPTRTEQSDLKFVVSASQGEFPRMVIALRNHEDAFYQTIRALNMAEKYQIPVILLSDQYLGDSTATVKPYDFNNLHIETYANPSEVEGEYLRYKFTEDGISPRLIPGKSTHLVAADSDEHDEKGHIIESSEERILMMDKRMKKLEKLELELQEPELIGDENAETLIVAWGSIYGPVADAVRQLRANGDNSVSALVFGDVFPLPKKLLTKMSKTAKNIINVEQNATGQLGSLIREFTGIECTSSILKYDGRQLSGDEIVEKLAKGGIN